MTDKNSLEEKQLYMGWLLAAKLAEWLGMESCVIDNDSLITIIIELPSGQVAIDIPVEYVEGNWKRYNKDEFFPYISPENIIKHVEDCLYGVLVSKHVLMIPEKKEETE